MAEEAKIPWLKLEVPRPRGWDFVALLVVLAGGGVAAANLMLAAQGSPSGAMTLAVAAVQMAVCLGSLLVLGKTAKEGTIYGNLLAVLGMLLGMSGVMLATGLWAAA